jgi:hypothetical protein
MNGDRRLTDFQELMRSWKELAPYNAAHILKISGAADLARWMDALGRTSAQIRLDQIAVEQSEIDLDAAIARELNREFETGKPPLRAIVIAAEHEHHLVLTYDHWFADSPSIRAFLRRTFAFYRGDVPDLPPLQSASEARSASALAAILDGIRAYRRHRRAARIHLRDPLDFRTGFFSRDFAAGAITGLRSNARVCGAKVNDVFLAAAAHVLGEHTAVQRAASRRDQVAIASAVDLRDTGGSETFGFDVSYFSVVVDRPEQTPVASLVRTIAAQTRAMKTDEEIARFDHGLKCGRLAWSLTSKPKRRAELFRKGLPLVAGISNVNLSGTWVEQSNRNSNGPRLLDYLRVSPVGPLLPLVFTLTTIADRLSLCVSFRTSAFTERVATELADNFVENLTAFSKTARP